MNSNLSTPNDSQQSTGFVSYWCHICRVEFTLFDSPSDGIVACKYQYKIIAKIYPRPGLQE